jgi:hypothetical protein
MDEIVTARVVFKMTPVQKEFDESVPECIAFLLDCPANKGYVLSYMHIGQHSEASIDFVRDCRLAKPEEYAELKTELESLGYDLIIKKRLNFR